MKKLLTGIAVGTMCILSSTMSFANSPITQKVFEDETFAVRDCRAQKELNMNIISWGADAVTQYANGNSLTTQKGSHFDKAGLKVNLKLNNDLENQLKNYLSCKSPFMRLTMGQLALVSKKLKAEPSTRPIIIQQLSWSVGGDTLTVAKGISKIEDLRGKKIALMANGPHLDYLTTILTSVNMKLSDVQLVFAKGLSDPYDLMMDGKVSASMLITPDANMITSGGGKNVGTGAEGSKKGSRVLLTTKSLSRSIADVIIVRSDFFKTDKARIQKFTKAWLDAESEFVNKMNDPKILAATAKNILEDSTAIADAEGLILDAETAGYSMNKRFFEDKKWPQNFKNLNKQIQTNFKEFGFVKSFVGVRNAKWDYDLMNGNIADVEQGLSAQEYDYVATALAAKAASGVLDEGLHEFKIMFQPKQTKINQARYLKKFEKVIALIASYEGAMITVEGHVDPNRYLKLKKQGANIDILKRTRQSAINQSLSRANSVRDSIIALSASKGFEILPSQFVTIGHGAKFPERGTDSMGEPLKPRTKAEWLSNMRVVFKLVNIESESAEFELL